MPQGKLRELVLTLLSSLHLVTYRVSQKTHFCVFLARTPLCNGLTEQTLFTDPLDPLVLNIDFAPYDQTPFIFIEEIID